MTPTIGQPRIPARIEYLRVENYRALKSIKLKDLTPLTVLLGPNGSGKSTVFDVFNFLSECFQYGLRHAWDRRGRAKECALVDRKDQSRLSSSIKSGHDNQSSRTTWPSAKGRGGHLFRRVLSWKRKPDGAPFHFLDYKNGQGRAVSGEMPDEKDQRNEVPLRSPDLIAVNTLGQFAEHPRVAALREFITDWYVSYLSVDDTRGQPEAGPQERLSKTGDNIANVVQYLKEQHPRSCKRYLRNCAVAYRGSIKPSPNLWLMAACSLRSKTRRLIDPSWRASPRMAR